MRRTVCGGVGEGRVCGWCLFKKTNAKFVKCKYQLVILLWYLELMHMNLWAEALLRSKQFTKLSRNYPHLIEPEGSLPSLQEPVICPYPEPYQFFPRSHSISWRSIWILSFHVCLGFHRCLFCAGFSYSKPCMPIRATFPAHLNLSNFVTASISWAQIMKGYVIIWLNKNFTRFLEYEECFFFSSNVASTRKRVKKRHVIVLTLNVCPVAFSPLNPQELSFTFTVADLKIKSER
jgi:hypothetical protein